MAKAKGTVSTTIKVRIPHLLLKAIDEWAALKGLPRSKAIQELVLRGLALWEETQRQKAA
jgi:hypothetical protein